MKTIDEYADEAARATSLWYGSNRPGPLMPIREWFKAHWARFPATDPRGVGKIIDGVAIEITGFIEASTEKPMPRLTGDCCQSCGSFAMVRTGTCLTCQDCGDSSGGCS